MLNTYLLYFLQSACYLVHRTTCHFNFRIIVSIHQRTYLHNITSTCTTGVYSIHGTIVGQILY